LHGVPDTLHGVPDTLHGVKVNFDQGLPDPAHFPVEILRRCLAETLEHDGAAALTYYGRGGPS
jgi:DNA-binding transcriptional MocR family regulator